MSNSQLMRARFKMGLHVSVSHNDKFRISSCLEDHRHSLQEEIGAFLYRQTSHEEKHGIHDVEALVALGVSSPLIFPFHFGDGISMNAIVDHFDLGTMHLVVRAHLFFQDTRHGNDPLGGVAGMSFNLTDPGALTTVLDIATSSGLCGVHGKDHSFVHVGKLIHSRSHQPVVAVNHIKATYSALHVQEVPDEGAAHILNFLNEIAVSTEVHLVVNDAHDLVLPSPCLGGACEDMNRMTNLVKGAGQLCDVRGHTARRDGVEGLPREHGNLQGPTSQNAVFRRLHVAQDAILRSIHLGLRHVIHDFLHAPLLVATSQDQFPEEIRSVRGLT
mmetsp:Transcript_44546/g.73221  ORF Transcript_44546/g.73221 Transcript_44546/m.73221 type:complete len:330 (-) Transcript_44546:2529-3518(-)